MSADRHVIVLVPSRVLRDETVITHFQEAGLTEHGVDERILWLGRPPSNTNGDSIGIFADQFEERVTEKLEALSKLKGIESILGALKTKLIHDKVCISEWQKILRSEHLGGGLANGRSQALSDMVDKLDGLSPFSDCCPRGQEAVEGAHDGLDGQGGEDSVA